MAESLVIRPSWDKTTTVLNGWAGLIVNLLRQQRQSVTQPSPVEDIDGTKATRQNIEQKLQSTGKLVVFYGHGESDALKGHKAHQQEEVVIDTANSHRLKDKLVYVVSCYSSETLGPDAVGNGALAYLGYSEKFGFFASQGVVDNFRQCANVGLEQLVKGNTIQVAFDEIRNQYDIYIYQYSRGSSATHLNAWSIFTTMFWNKHHLKLDGDHTQKL